MQNPAKDRLTRREVVAYRVLHGLGLAGNLAMFCWLFIWQTIEPDLPQLIAVLTFSLVMVVFGFALRLDIRVVHGCAWLRGPTKSSRTR